MFFWYKPSDLATEEVPRSVELEAMYSTPLTLLLGVRQKLYVCCALRSFTNDMATPTLGCLQ